MSRGIVACDGVLTHEQAQKENVGTAVDSNTSRFVERRKYTSCRLSLGGNCGDERNQHKHPCSTKHTPLYQSWFLSNQMVAILNTTKLFQTRVWRWYLLFSTNASYHNGWQLKPNAPKYACTIFDLYWRRVAEEGVCGLEGSERGRELEFPTWESKALKAANASPA